MHLADDDRLVRVSLRPSQIPSAEKSSRDDAAVDLERVLEDQKAVLYELERGDEHAAEDAVDEDGLLQQWPARGNLPGGGMFPP